MAMQAFPISVGLGAAITVMIATFLNLPVSTTHALVGALSGAGMVASTSGINWIKLSEKFLAPLLGGPLISILIALLLYPLFKKFRKKLGVQKQTCLCIGKKVIATAPIVTNSSAAFLKAYPQTITIPEIVIQNEAYCTSSYSGSIVGISARSILDKLHYLSSGLVCFARGLNDTPKIAALLLIGSRFSIENSIFVVGIHVNRWVDSQPSNG